MNKLALATGLRAQIETETRTAFPRECCGLIEGVRVGELVHATILHPTRNIATDSDGFEIDPAEHIRLLRAAREGGRQIVGCYHSHPNGKAGLSERDREGAGEEGFVWLVASALSSDGPVSLAAFLFSAGTFRAMSLALPAATGSNAGIAGSR